MVRRIGQPSECGGQVHREVVAIVIVSVCDEAVVVVVVVDRHDSDYDPGCHHGIARSTMSVPVSWTLSDDDVPLLLGGDPLPQISSHDCTDAAAASR